MLFTKKRAEQQAMAACYNTTKDMILLGSGEDDAKPKENFDLFAQEGWTAAKVPS